MAGFLLLTSIGVAATPVNFDIVGTDEPGVPDDVIINAASSIKGSATQDGSYTVGAVKTADNQSQLTVTSDGAYRGKLVVDNTGTFTTDVAGTTIFTKETGAASGGLLVNDGSYTNGGVTEFHAGSEYSGAGAFLNQHELLVDTGMANNSALTLLNAMQQNAGETTITGSSAIFGAAGFTHTANTVGSGFVLRTSGNYAGAVNVNNAYLTIAGDSTTNPTAVTFNGTVNARYIIVTDREATFTQNVTVGSAVDGFSVDGNGRAIFSGSGNLTNGNLFVGNAVLGNGSATFTNGGSFSSNGAVLVTSMGGGQSVLTFADGSNYAIGAAGGTITGNGGVFYYSTGTTNFEHLFNNTTLTNASSLYITESHGSGANLALAAADAASMVTVRDGGSFKQIDVKSAQLIFGNSSQATNIAGNVNASTVDIRGTVDMESNYSMTTTGGVTVSNGGRFQVTQGTGTTLSVVGDLSAAGGSHVVVGEGKVLQVTGDVNLAAGSTVHFAANNTSMSHINATGNINITGKTDVVLTGTRDQILTAGYYIMQGNGVGSIVDVSYLHNLLYNFEIDDTSGNDRVVISGYRSMLDVMTDAFGEDGLSKNKINGGNYTDEVLSTQWGSNNTSLNEYIQLASGSNLSAKQSFIAFGQLYGEYGAYASASLQNNANSFVNAISRHMGLGSKAAASCAHVCVVDECSDPCGETEEVVVVTGSDIATGKSRIWAGGFGDWEKHDNKRRIHGYDYSSAGVVVGYDYDLDGFVMGVAGAYNYGTLKVNDLGTKYRSDMLSLGGYAGYVHESGVYARATVAYNHGWNEYDVNMVLGGMKKGDYQNHAFTGALEIGYQAELAGGFYMTPSAGVTYTHLRTDDWTETLSVASAPLVANRFEFGRHNVVDIPVSLAIGRDIQGDGYVIRPEVRGSYIYQAAGARNKIRTGYSGSNATTTMYGVDAGAHRGVVGAALTANFAGGVGISASYDYEFSGRYSNHSVNGSVSVAF